MEGVVIIYKIVGLIQNRKSVSGRRNSSVSNTLQGMSMPSCRRVWVGGHSGWKDFGGSLGPDHVTYYSGTLWIRRQYLRWERTSRVEWGWGGVDFAVDECEPVCLLMQKVEE